MKAYVFLVLLLLQFCSCSSEPVPSLIQKTIEAEGSKVQRKELEFETLFQGVVSGPYLWDAGGHTTPEVIMLEGEWRKFLSEIKELDRSIKSVSALNEKTPSFSDKDPDRREMVIICVQEASAAAGLTLTVSGVMRREDKITIRFNVSGTVTGYQDRLQPAYLTHIIKLKKTFEPIEFLRERAQYNGAVSIGQAEVIAVESIKPWHVQEVRKGKSPDGKQWAIEFIYDREKTGRLQSGVEIDVQTGEVTSQWDSQQ